MSVRPVNLGWVLVVLILGQELGRAQIRRMTGASTLGQANTNALTIVWSPSPSPGVIGYAVYWGLSDDTCTNRISLRNVTDVTLVGFRRRVTYYLAVSAYDANGEESPWSNRIQYSRTPIVMPMTAPITVTNLLQMQRVDLAGSNQVLRLSFTGQAGSNYQLQTTEDFQSWEVLRTTNCVQPQLVVYELPYSPTTPHRFFRLLENELED